VSRDISATNASASEDQVIHLVHFVRLDFPEGTTRICDAARDYTTDIGFGQEVFAGVGTLGTIDAIEENAEAQSTGIRLTLSGIDPTIISRATSSKYQGRTCDVAVGFVSEAGILLDNPTIVWSGMMDRMTASVADEAAITLTAEDYMALWSTPPVARYTHNDQLRLDPTDNFFDQVLTLANKKIKWGAYTVTAPPSTFYPLTGNGGQNLPFTDQPNLPPTNPHNGEIL
jgi:hypothetical protein